MAKLTIKQIQQRAHELLDEAPRGLRWGEIHKAIRVASPETPPNTVTDALTALFRAQTDIAKIAKGTYQLARYQEQQETEAQGAAETSTQADAAEPVAKTSATPAEAAFYSSFADWLVQGPKRSRLRLPWAAMYSKVNGERPTSSVFFARSTMTC